jgi:sugar fermentation stimulation protein A
LQFPEPLVRGRFLAREKRFLVHVRLDGGLTVTAHTNNTGSMRGCLFPDAAVWLSPARNPARKLKWTLELVETPAGVPVGVNTALANTLVREALTARMIPGLGDFTAIRPEVRYASGSGRADFLLTGPDGPCWVEVKNVSWVEAGRARFPDAPTARGRRHLVELAERVRAGEGAALVFCVQREDATRVEPADDVDPEYGRLLRAARKAGVRVAGLAAVATPRAITPRALLEVRTVP